MTRRPADDDPGPSPARQPLSRRGFMQATGVTAGAVAAGVLSSDPAEASTAAPPTATPPYGTTPPFSFTYNGTSSATLLKTWNQTTSTRPAGGASTETTTTWSEPGTGFQVRWVATQYPGLPTQSWVVYFDNTGTGKTPILSDVLAADFTVPGGSGDWTIRTNNGSTALPDDYSPLDLSLDPGTFRLFTTNGGRPTNGNATSGTATPWTAVVGGTATGYIDNTQHYTTASGASAALTFTGTSIAWIGAKNVDVGIADVYIDGVLKASVDCYASSWLRQQTLFSASGLSDGQHTITVTDTGKANPSAIGTILDIDAFEVGTASGTTVVDDSDPSIVYTNPPPGSGTNIVNGWPYLNVDWGTGGLIAALGWQGQWALETARNSSGGLTVRGGMSHNAGIGDGDDITATELTSLWLGPGESISTPQIVIQPWSGGDWIDAQNVWRQWFVKWHMPHNNGQPVQPLIPTQSNDYFTNQYDTAQDELQWLTAYGQNDETPATGGDIDHWWIDAGWYALPAGAQDWNHPGTWVPDPARYPQGLVPITDEAHKLGMKTIVWFEPQRVTVNTWLYDNHPEWLLKSSAGQTDNFLLDFTNPAVRQWGTRQIGGLIGSQHIDVYREDFNIDPLPFWVYNDPADRRGITQIRYVEGHVGYWQGLQAQHPGLVIDTCASGGRRLDLQTLSLAVNFLRSDHVLDPLGNQNHGYGISRWVALSGAVIRVTGTDDAYSVRSSMAPSMHIAVDVDNATPPLWTTMKQLTQEWKRISGDLYGDYYPLLPYSDQQSAWMAWEFNTPMAGTGFVQAFRRPSSTTASQQLVLRGLNPSATYQLIDEAAGTTTKAKGSDLMTTGMTVSLSTAPAATTIHWAIQ